MTMKNMFSDTYRLSRFLPGILLLGAITCFHATALAEERVIVLAEGPMLPASTGSEVAQSLISRGLIVVADSEVKAALSFGGYAQTTPRSDEELRRLLSDLGARYLLELQAKPGASPDELAVTVVAWNPTEKRVALGMVARATSGTQISQLVFQPLDQLSGTMQATAADSSAVSASPAPPADSATTANPESAVTPPAETATSAGLRPQGIYFGALVGFGSGKLSNSDADASVSGLGPALLAHVGYMHGDLGLGLYGAMAGSFSPTFEAAGMSNSPDDAEMQMGGLGGFVDYYPPSLPNWRIFARAGILLSTVKVGDMTDESHGFGFGAGLAREWKLNHDWNYGLGGAIMFGSTSASDPEAELSASTYSLMGSIRGN